MASTAQLWLTSVLTDEEVPNALVLGFSLKEAMTSRKVGVIASSKISGELKAALAQCFDFFFPLEESWNKAGLKSEDFVKVSALTIRSFKKIVFLEPYMLALKNCDEIFDQYNNFRTFILPEEGKASLFIVQPSFQAFNGILAALACSTNGKNLESFLRTWIKNQNVEYPFLHEKYNRIFDMESGMLLGNEDEICIVNMMNNKELKGKTGQRGLIAKQILDKWEKIYQGYVQPLLSSNNQSNIFSLDSPLPLTYSKEPIAIVGMSCRYPGANNLEEFWNLLVEGQDATGNPPEFRWLREECSRSMKPEFRKTNAGFLKCPVDEFDSKFFGISPKEMVNLDPQHRLLHELVWEGLEDAAVNPKGLRGTNGAVFIGSWTNDYRDILEHGGNNEFYRAYMGNSIGAAAARLSFLLGMTGPSIATESGCSSAMVAVHLACKSLQNGETNFALACGVNLLLHPFDKDEMPMVISPDGHCKTFDAKADGFARGEGCGVLVLKRLSDAVRDSDNIWGLIRGSGMTQEGVSKSMGTPTVHCESLAMEQALADAEVEPEDVSYVEAHGTGTPVGDPMEVAAIAKAYHSSNRKEPLLIGSVKTNVGHTESCSGITGIMKVILAMQHEIIPPHRNFETLNPSINLDAVPAVIPLTPVDWPKVENQPRLAGVSSFGITGTDAHAIIEEPPVLPPNTLTNTGFERPWHLMKITAKTDEALDILLENYKEHLTSNPNDFKDLAYTSNIGRADFSQRAIIVAKSKEDAIKSIQQNKLMRGEESHNEQGKVCFLFTGQGSQYPGMAKQLYNTSPVFRMHFEYCEKILKNKYNIDIAQVLWSENESNEVSRTIYSQTSIFCVEYALLKLWESWGIKPDYALGHSLGEFAAAVCAGILNVEDAIKLVAERSRLIDLLPRGKMLVIKADKQRVDSLMNKFAGNDQNKLLDYAAINSAEQTVVAGDSEVVMHFANACKQVNLKYMVLEATHAFHSKHMDPILNDYRAVAQTVTVGKGNTCKYISGMMGSCLDASQIDAEYWVQHTREKVNFLFASKKAVELECNTFVEIGPQPVLSALTMINNDSQLLCLPSLKRNENEWETLLNTLAKLYIKGMDIDWKMFDQFYGRRKIPNLPHYPFIGKKFWPDLLAVTGTSIHPLVGSVISNASSTKLFQCGLNLSTLDYVKDHAIGENVIFPGAGYLEMCLAAGLATVESSSDTLSAPSRAMKVENLYIEAPLCLEESKTCQVQTVVGLNISNENQGDWNDMKVSIYRKMESETTKWLPHAKATFFPVPTAEEKNVSFDLAAFSQTLKTASNDDFIKEIYDKLASVGLKFGPFFRSLEKVWRNEEECTLLAKVKALPEQDSQNQYILHPVVLDAIIQAIMMLRLTSNLKKKLYVPIKIGKFVWLSAPSTDSNDLYIHAFSSKASNTSSDCALLLDSTGKVLAMMSSVEFIDTTVKAIESVLEQQTSSMPDVYEEVWKPSIGPLQYRGDWKQLRANYSDLNIIPDDFNIPPPHLADLFNHVEKLCYLHMLNSLYECGFQPILGKTFDEESLQIQLEIQPDFRLYFGFILQVLQMEGILQSQKESSDMNRRWMVGRMPPTREEVEMTLTSSQFTTELCARYSTTPLFTKVGENLSKIMTGKEPALNILFPQENQVYPSVAEFYTTYEKIFQLRDSARPKLCKRLNHIKKAMQGSKFIFRVLEVGAGTGSYTRFFLELLEDMEIEFEYTYSDISAAFFAGAEKRFEKQLKQFKFRKLNIEQDPIDQGFTPEYYDIVCASDVIHTTKDIKDSLRNMRMLLKPNGLLDIQEITKPHRFVTFLFGLLDGFWRFEDFALRPRHCALSSQSWNEVLSSSGFELTGSFPMMNNHHSIIWAVRTPAKLEILEAVKPKTWLLFENGCQVSSYLRQRFGESTTRRLITVEKGAYKFENGNGENSFRIRTDDEENFLALFKMLKSQQVDLEGIIYCWALNVQGKVSQDEILYPYFSLTKSLLSAGFNPRLIGLTSGTIPIGGNTDLSSFPVSTIWGFTKSLKNENNDMPLKIIDVESGILNEKQMEEIFCELWSFDDKEIMLAYRDGTRFYPKFVPHKAINNSLKLPPGTDRFQLILPETRSISDLQFGTLDTTVLKGYEVEVQIKASALNFRDVLSVIKPSEEFKDINTVGFDFAGVIKRVGEKVTKWKVGDRVCGCNIYFTALPSHVTLNEDLLLGLPNNLSLCDAATMPAVYITSVLCLMDVAKIRKEDVVLIHTATGGVGLSAIEICKDVGCTIIATAGSKRKQNYLKSLGIQHIFHSRNTQYGDDILKATNGRGVDVVLNSLTSEGFKEATLKACAKRARFVEMSKLNTWKPEEVKELRPDVEYTVIDVSTSDATEWKRLLNSLKTLQDKNVVKPIPYAMFDALNIKEALQHMQKAKHIGKIVCTMPELRTVGGEIKVLTPMFNENSTYLITGGLGGIGFVVCNWMIEKGAKHVILAGRSSPTSSIQQKINELNSNGANVIPVQLDVGNFTQCKDLIQNQIDKMGLPPLKGVMHAAGTLSDGLIINQDWQKLSSTFNTKINGTLNLHELTKDLNLEHFVVFSSMAALFGSPGQCNHSAGNSFEDALVHYRYSQGLPATTINWGQWGEVGVATEIDLPGLKTLSNLQGITGLEYALKTQRTQLSVVNVESFLMMSKLFPHLAVYLDERVWKSGNSTASVGIKSDEFWQQYDSKSDPQERITLLKDQLKNILRTVLKLDSNETIHEHGNFQEMGVDSLMFVEIKNHLQALFGLNRVAINASALKDCNNITLLAETLLKIIEGDDGVEDETPPTWEEVNELIKEDCVLPEHIRTKPGQTVVSVNDIKTVLLTGCTGTLGAYILKELTNKPQITQVICVMRLNTKEEGDERLIKVLRSKGIISQVDMDKVTCVNGNVALSNLGMNPDIWQELCGTVDAIINCGARVQHNEHYKKRKSNTDVRAVNIGGMKHLLEFASENKLKHVLHASSLLAVKTTDEEGKVSEDWPNVGDYDGVTTFAYPISKFVCDYLAKEAVHRGIPCKSLRLPFISGEEETGRCAPESNHVLLRYMFILKNGIMPNIPIPMSMLPVDFCAQLCVRLFLDERAEPNVYNIGNSNPDMDQAFVKVAERLGYNVEIVEFSEFTKCVQEVGKEDSQSALNNFKELYSDSDALMSIITNANVIQRWIEGVEVFKNKKVAELIPNFYESQLPTMDYIYNDLMYVKSQGWFEKFGL